MRISIHTLGTRGDVQPYIPLARELLRRGHEVQISAPEQYVGLVAAKDISCFSLPGEVMALIDSPEAKAAIAGGSGFGAGFKLIKHFKPMMRRLLDQEWQGARSFDPELLIYHPKGLGVPHIAEKLGRPAVLASPLPGFTPTSAFPSPMLPFASLGPLNRLSHGFTIRGADIIYAKLLKAWRANSLGLTPKFPRHSPPVTLYAYSQHVVPVPADWGEDAFVSGYWFDDEPDWTVPQDLQAFMAAGDKPVYIGFGSMPGHEPAEFTKLIVDALQLAGLRGVINAGGGALSNEGLPSTVYPIGLAPHGQLFPLMSATVHHGGAGTTGASLRAGLPSVIIPFFGDQPFWGRRVASLGAGPNPLNLKKLTPQLLAEALIATQTAEMQTAAAEVGVRIRAEDGVARALDFLEQRFPL